MSFLLAYTPRHVVLSVGKAEEAVGKRKGHVQYVSITAADRLADVATVLLLCAGTATDSSFGFIIFDGKRGAIRSPVHQR